MPLFYQKTLRTLLARGDLHRSGSVLVVCGGHRDADVLRDESFENVTISNLSDIPGMAEAYKPFKWARVDAEDIPFADDSFDYVLVHAGLHHCRSPHRGLLEMYRVARKHVLVFEARDSVAMWLACRAGIALDYETACGPITNYKAGGVRDSAIPNYVYRWTEREVLKTLQSAAPETQPKVDFFYGLELNPEFVETYSPIRAKLLKRLSPILEGVAKVLPSQTNCFAFSISKPDIPSDLQPWLSLKDSAIVPNLNWKWKGS